MFSNSKVLLSQSKRRSLLYNFQQFNFARTLSKFIPIYPGDKVVVLPPWGQTQLSPYAKKKVKMFHKEDAKIQSGTVLKVMRKKGQAIVSRVNLQPKYVSPSKFMNSYEMGDIARIKKTNIHKPIDINRVRLRDTSFKDSLRILPIKVIKNEEGKRIRVHKQTKAEIPNPLANKDHSYAHRVTKKKDGPKDTSNALRAVKTYQGENFEFIIKQFINKIREKETIESKLVLKDTKY